MNSVGYQGSCAGAAGGAVWGHRVGGRRVKVDEVGHRC